jgi:hypothetical protein
MSYIGRRLKARSAEPTDAVPDSSRYQTRKPWRRNKIPRALRRFIYDISSQSNELLDDSSLQLLRLPNRFHPQNWYPRCR